LVNAVNTNSLIIQGIYELGQLTGSSYDSRDDEYLDRLSAVGARSW